MSTVEPISSGSSHLPGEDRHLALTKQRQASFRDAVKGSSGRGMCRLGFWKGSGEEFVEMKGTWEQPLGNLGSNGLVVWNSSKSVSCPSSQTGCFITLLPPALCHPPLRSSFP